MEGRVYEVILALVASKLPPLSIKYYCTEMVPKFAFCLPFFSFLVLTSVLVQVGPGRVYLQWWFGLGGIPTYPSFLIRGWK